MDSSHLWRAGLFCRPHHISVLLITGEANILLAYPQRSFLRFDWPFGLGSLIAGFCLVFSLPGLLAGYGLLKYRPWARILTLILCFLNLLNIPLGTILGAYGLWVLLSSEGQQFYQHQAALSPEG